jgi:hypothetical protein
MTHPYDWRFYWIALSVTLAMGAPFGLLGGLVATACVDAKITPRAVIVDMLLGGFWWSVSALLPSWGFPATLIRSLVGAFLIPMPVEICVWSWQRLKR